MIHKKNNLVYLVMIYQEGGNRIPPFSLMLLSNVLKKNNFDIKVIHCSEKQIIQETEKIIKDNPLFVGFSVITGLPTLYSAQMSKLIKEKSKKIKNKIPIVWGGVHPSLLGEQCIQEKYIDYIIQGEGEISLVNLAKCILKKIEPKDVEGVGYKKNNKIIINKKPPLIKDLDEYGYDFDCINLNEYVYTTEYQQNEKKIKLRSLSYYGSRGCPHDCGFCYNLTYNQRRWRAYSSEKVIKDITYLKTKYDIECFDFWDDNFFVNKNRALEILEAIKTYSKIEIRIDYITDELAKKLKELKVIYMLIGGESGSERILKLMKKGFDKKKFLQGVKFLDKYQLPAQYSFILGIPSETKKEMYQTLDIMFNISEIHKKSSFTVGIYLPYPGTELYNEAVKRGFKEPENTEEWNKVDRWRNTVQIPWIKNKICLNIRHLFAMLSWKNPLIRWWVKFRIKHKILKIGIDLKIIIVSKLFFEKMKRWIKNRSI